MVVPCLLVFKSKVIARNVTVHPPSEVPIPCQGLQPWQDNPGNVLIPSSESQTVGELLLKNQSITSMVDEQARCLKAGNRFLP